VHSAEYPTEYLVCCANIKLFHKYVVAVVVQWFLARLLHGQFTTVMSETESSLQEIDTTIVKLVSQF